MRGATAGRRALIATAVAAVAAALVLPAGAAAGGFATVGLSSLPDGTPPGTPWRVTLTILQHGRTPLTDVEPTVRIRSADGKTTRTFAAKPAGKAGVYTADVVFPAAGRWRYSVADGFSQTHTFAPVAIGSSRTVPVPGSQSGAGPAGALAPTTRDSANVGAALGAAVVAGLLAALLAFALLRRRADAAVSAPR
jgi:YtkA-like protein